VVATFEGGYVNNVVTFLLNRTPSIAVKVGLEAATVIVFKFLLAKNPVREPEPLVIVVVAAGIAMLVTPCGREFSLISMLVTEGSISTAPEQSDAKEVSTFAAETV
jgi:uncharacterized membrane protein YciS (DUF1049 family)